MLAAFGFLGFTNIHHMNALKNLNALGINGVAAVIFIIKGLVDLAFGPVDGGRGDRGRLRRGRHRAVHRPTRRARGIVLIGLSLALWLLWQQVAARYFG